MKCLLTLFLGCAFLLCAQFASAAEIKNQWFSLELPQGWEQMKMPQQKDAPGETIMLVNKKANCAVSFSFAPNNGITAEKLAKQTHEQSKAGGMTVGPIEEKDGIYSFTTVKKPATGWAYFGANDKSIAITTIWTPKLDAAKPLFDAIKAADPALLPKF